MIVALLGITAVSGLLLVTAGLRGRRLDDRPLCRSCGYDLSGLGSEPSRCPECGRDLQRKRSRRRGHRRKRRALVAVGGALVFVAVIGGGLVGWHARHGFDLDAIKPVWWLVWEAKGGDDPAAAAALRELASRVTRKDISDGQLDDVVATALAQQSDLNRPWRSGWADVIETARDVGMLGDDEWATYLSNAVRFELTVRPFVRPGDPLYRHLVGTARTGLTQLGRRRTPLALRVYLVESSIDGRHLSLSDRRIWRVKLLGSPTMSWPAATWLRETLLPKQWEVDAERPFYDTPGWHRFSSTWRVRVSDEQGWALEWDEVHDADFEVCATNTEMVELVFDKALREEMARSIRLVECKMGSIDGNGGYARGTIEFTSPPVDGAFDVVWIDAETGTEWHVGSITTRDDLFDKFGGRPNGYFRRYISGFRGQEIDVILRPNPDLAAHTYDLTRIWNEEIDLGSAHVSWPGRP